jgi:hypothetical protein
MLYILLSVHLVGSETPKLVERQGVTPVPTFATVLFTLIGAFLLLVTAILFWTFCQQVDTDDVQSANRRIRQHGEIP